MTELPPVPSRLTPSSHGGMMPSPVGDYIRYENYNLLRYTATLCLDDNVKLFAAYKKALENASSANRMYDTLAVRTADLTSLLREYLELSSIDGDKKRQELRQRMKNMLAPKLAVPELKLGDRVFIEKYVGTADSYAEVRQLDDIFVWVSNSHWTEGHGNLTMKKLFATEVIST